MLERFVILKFRAEETDRFLSIFKTINSKVAYFPGCFHLELRRSEKHPGWFMTYSVWADEKALNAYRDSELFAEVWRNVKPLFSAKAEALSITEEGVLAEQKQKDFTASGEPWTTVWRKEN